MRNKRYIKRGYIEKGCEKRAYGPLMYIKWVRWKLSEKRCNAGGIGWGGRGGKGGKGAIR